MKPDWKAQEKQQNRLKRFTKLYANMLWNNTIDAQRLMNVYDRTEKQPELKLKRLLRSQTVQTMINNDLETIYKGKGIDASKVIDEEISVLNSCKETTDDGVVKYIDRTNALKVITNWRESLDMKPKQQQITTTETNYLQLLSKDKDGTKQITAKQTKELPPGTGASIENSKETSQNDADND